MAPTDRITMTMRDRAVKALRLRWTYTAADANVYTLSPVAAFNARFARPQKIDSNAHRPLRSDEKPVRCLPRQALMPLLESLLCIPE